MSSKRTLLGNVNVSKLTKGIHKNIVISDIDVEERKRNGEVSKKMIYIKLVQVNPTSRERVKEVEVSWWKPDPIGNKYFSDNLLELCFQVAGIMEIYMSKEDVDAVFDGLFEDLDFKTVDQIKEYNWKKSQLNTFLPEIAERFAKAMEPFVGLDGKLLHVKLTTDMKGMGAEMPKYGNFMEEMTDQAPTLKFSKSELKNHSLSGVVENSN